MSRGKTTIPEVEKKVVKPSEIIESDDDLEIIDPVLCTQPTAAVVPKPASRLPWAPSVNVGKKPLRQTQLSFSQSQK